MVDLRELKDITETLQAEIIKGTLLVEDTPLLNLAKQVKFDFYHTDSDKHGEISSISMLKEKDNRFNHAVFDDGQYEFPEFCPFFRGCIAISETS